MAGEKKTRMRVFDSVTGSYVVHYPETSADQVTLGAGGTAQAHVDDTGIHHTHGNKAVLEGITSTKVTNWDNANTKAHDHANKSVLDGITSAMITAWNGKGTTKVVASITARNGLTGMATGDVCYVTDATGDATVKSGGAMYIYDGAQASNKWIKVAEFESMDVLVAWADIQNRPSSTVATIDDAVGKRHSHTNQSVLDGITAALITNWSAAYTHSTAAHAPSSAQKNSDITKAEIEAKLTGVISSHSHAQVGAKVTVSSAQPTGGITGDVWFEITA